MDILGMLQNDVDELCEEDIEMIEEELAVGDYTYEYKQQCRILIMNVTHYFEQKKKEKVYTVPDEITSRLFKTEDEVTVKTKSDEEGNVEEVATEKVKTNAEIFREEIKKMRSKRDPEKSFLDFVENNDYITNEFIDQNFNELVESERNILLRNRQFSEDFLEKYFEVLDHGTLALNQLYSEEFYMKHYNDMPIKVVLQRSKNPWKQKAKRSKKLDSFLRLKGVRI